MYLLTRLRKLMLDELERRNYTQATRRAYVLAVEQFAKHFHRPPDELGLDDIRDYQVHLFRVRKLKPASVAVRLAALRFLFVAVLKRPWTGNPDIFEGSTSPSNPRASPPRNRGLECDC